MACEPTTRQELIAYTTSRQAYQKAPVESRMNLGTKSKLVFHDDIVIKTASSQEPRFMRRFPKVFVPVLWEDVHVDSSYEKNAIRYAMPRYRDVTPTEEEREEALFAGLKKLKLLWALEHAREFQPDALTQHITRVIYEHKLLVGIGVHGILGSLAFPDSHTVIHGDPTYANILRHPSNDSWWWIDPLYRDYIPGDPHVDLGKLFQSCWGYEFALANRAVPKFNRKLAHALAVKAGLDWEQGQLWCYVHMVRLLPYQKPHMRKLFEQILKDWTLISCP